LRIKKQRFLFFLDLCLINTGDWFDGYYQKKGRLMGICYLKKNCLVDINHRQVAGFLILTINALFFKRSIETGVFFFLIKFHQGKFRP